MKKSFIEVNNSFFTILKYFKKIKSIIFFKFGTLLCIEVLNIFDLFFKNLFDEKKYKENYFNPFSYITLGDIKVYHKKTKNNKSKINLYTILKQIPEDLLDEASAIKIIIPADYFSRVTYKDAYSQGYDVSIVRLYKKIN